MDAAWRERECIYIYIYTYTLSFRNWPRTAARRPRGERVNSGAAAATVTRWVWSIGANDDFVGAVQLLGHNQSSVPFTIIVVYIRVGGKAFDP